MVAFTSAHLKLIPPIAALLAGGAVAVAVTLLPSDMLDGFVLTGGVAALIPAAAPPLGMTARLLLGAGGGVVIAMIVWSALYLVFGEGGMIAPRHAGEPSVRRADAHPDAPPRRPMSAADLGVPLMEVSRPITPRHAQSTVTAELPVNRNEPILNPAPAAARVPVEEAEMVDPIPVVRRRPTRHETEQSASIDKLLERLEEGAARRASQTR